MLNSAARERAARRRSGSPVGMRAGGDAVIVFARRKSSGIVAEKLHHGQIAKEVRRAFAQILVQVVADHVQDLHQGVGVVARERFAAGSDGGQDLAFPPLMHDLIELALGDAGQVPGESHGGQQAGADRGYRGVAAALLMRRAILAARLWIASR